MRDDEKLEENLKESLQNIWLAGLGALAAAEEEGSRLFDSLVERGSRYGGEGRARVEEIRESVVEAAARARDSAEERGERLEAAFEERLGSALERLGVPSRAEIERLRARMEELTEAVRDLDRSRSATSGDPVDPTPGPPGSDPGPGGSDG